MNKNLLSLINKFLLIVGLLSILLAGVSIILNHHGLALQIINSSFFILLLATIGYIGEMKLKK